MPKRTASGTAGLIKRHVPTCRNRRHPERCDCSWRGRYLNHEVVLAKWAGVAIDPRVQAAALTVFTRMKAAIDAHAFDREGERPPLGDDLTLRAFIVEWKSRYAEKHGLSQASLYPMLGVIERGRLGRLTLQALVENPAAIEAWLDHPEPMATRRGVRPRRWSAKTWNGYHGLLHALFERATTWTVDGQPRMARNPMAAIERKVWHQPDHFRKRHLEEDVEARLFAACALLNRSRPLVTRAKLTQALADAIRARLAAGETGKALAAAYRISPAVVSAIKLGDIWNAERKTTPGTKGDEMRRRLIAAFDGGLRAGEMLQITLDHINWRAVKGVDADGVEISGYEITLPPTITKGGKRTGEAQYVLAATPRFKAMLEARRFALRANPPNRQFIFGTEAGHRQQGFRRMWRELFTLAGLTWGRDRGIVWHTTRHEFISRVAETTKDPVLAQEAARHADLATTQLYFHTRRSRQLAAAAGIHRR